MLVAPSDHVIPDAARFRDAVQAAAPAASAGQLVTFGIRPDRPETGYGWLELSTPTPDFAPVPQPLRSFVEKPDLAKAEALLAGGMHLWNAGYSCSPRLAILEAFAAHAPEVLTATRAAFEARRKGPVLHPPRPCALGRTPRYFNRLRGDGARAEPDRRPLCGAWSDLGDWQAVWREAEADTSGTVTAGPATALDCQDTLLQATSEAQQLVGIGLKDIIAVAMPDAVLVAHKDRAQEVKQAVAALKAKAAPQAETCRATTAPGAGTKASSSARASR